MITLIRLANWRAYGDVELQLEPGTTFVIGMNGVGKTSLVEAVRWAFDRTAKADVEFIRKGERRASVEVHLRVGAADMRIARAVHLGTGSKPFKNPKTEMETSIDGREVAADELFSRLEAAWGADIGFVTRTAFLDLEFRQSSTDSELGSHLSRAYGLDALEELARELDTEVKQADAAAGAEARSAAQLTQQVDEARRTVAEREAQLRSSEPRMADLDRGLREASEAFSMAEAAHAAVADQERWDAEWHRIAGDAADLIGEQQTGTDLRPLLKAALDGASLARDEARESSARLRERIAVIEGALAALDAAGGECPVCRRPLDDEGRAHAHDVHAADLERDGRALEELDIDAPSEVVTRADELLRRADRLADRPEVPSPTPSDLSAAQEALERATAARDVLLGERGVITGQLELARRSVRELVAEIESSSGAVAAFRRLGALTAARDALRETAREVLKVQLEPIGREVSARWDGVFPDRPGLSVDADGAIRRAVADGVIEYASFSSGEKTVARLLVKLATLITTTKVPFCWIDEPLEHLDERSRLVIARTLAQFGKAQVLDQILVTTYEQSLVVMVGQSTDDPHVEYLGTSQVGS